MAFRNWLKPTLFFSVAASMANCATSVFAQTVSSQNCTCDSDDDDDEGMVVPKFGWDKQTIIGVSCLVSSFILITSAFCIFSKRPKRVFTCEVTLRKEEERSEWKSYLIPSLKVEKIFTLDDQKSICEIGTTAFVKKDVRNYLISKNNRNENISQDTALQDVLIALMKDKLEENLDRPHDHTISVTVTDFEGARKQRGFFEYILQPLTQSTLFFEIMFGSVQTIGLLSIASKVLPISDQANFILNVSLVSFSTISMLVEILYLSASQNFMAGYGISMDNFFRKKFRKLCGKKIEEENETHGLKKIAEDNFHPFRIKELSAKVFLGLCMLVRLYTDVTEDYQTTTSINSVISYSPQSLLPYWLLYVGSMMEFGLNQLNDPVEYVSGWTMGCSAIEMYFKARTDKLVKARHLENEKQNKLENKEDKKEVNPMLHELRISIPSSAKDITLEKNRSESATQKSSQKKIAKFATKNSPIASLGSFSIRSRNKTPGSQPSAFSDSIYLENSASPLSAPLLKKYT